MADRVEVTRHTDFDPDDVEWVRERPDRGAIEIVEPDPTWPEQFAEVAGRIADALGPAALAIEHVGSTSVPDLPAKPVIDVDLIVTDSADEASYVPALESAGFLLLLREPGFHQHRLLAGESPTVNLHVWSPGSPEAERHRLLRDWLVDHPADRARYADAKRSAAAATNGTDGTVQEYNERKQDVIRDILDRVFRAHGLA